MKKIKDLLEDANLEPKEGKIRLSMAVEWNDKVNFFMESLGPWLVPGSSHVKDLENGYKEYSFTINDAIDQYTIVYNIESIW